MKTESRKYRAQEGYGREGRILDSPSRVILVRESQVLEAFAEAGKDGKAGKTEKAGKAAKEYRVLKVKLGKSMVGSTSVTGRKYAKLSQTFILCFLGQICLLR
jgi:hypothetical protein